MKRDFDFWIQTAFYGFLWCYFNYQAYTHHKPFIPCILDAGSVVVNGKKELAKKKAKQIASSAAQDADR